MVKVIPTSYLHGIEAIPVDVIANKDGAKIIEHNGRRVLYSVRLDSSGSVSSLFEHVVNVRTSPLCKRAPDRLATRKPG
jgi:hypothetical protein